MRLVRCKDCGRRFGGTINHEPDCPELRGFELVEVIPRADHEAQLGRLLTSDETVEAAARAAFCQDDLGGHIKGRWTWDTINEDGRKNYRETVRAVLAAVLAKFQRDQERR